MIPHYEINIDGANLVTSLPKLVVHKIVHEKPEYRKVSARCVPKQLNEEYKFQCMIISFQL